MQLTQMNVLHILVIVLALLSPIEAYIEGLYCGTENCYDGKNTTQNLEFIGGGLFILSFSNKFR